jgi:hypothetical protein
MVIVNPILEREDDSHGETIWNTAGILNQILKLSEKSRS